MFSKLPHLTSDTAESNIYLHIHALQSTTMELLLLYLFKFEIIFANPRANNVENNLNRIPSDSQQTKHFLERLLVDPRVNDIPTNMVKALCYQPKGRGSWHDEVKEFFHFT
jgi:hypothetical protein